MWIDSLKLEKADPRLVITMVSPLDLHPSFPFAQLLFGLTGATLDVLPVVFAVLRHT